MNRKKNLRRQYLINPRFQWALITFFSSLAFLTVLMNLYAFRLIFQKYRDNLFSLGLAPDHPMLLILEEQRQDMLRMVLSSSGLLFVFLLVGGVLVSHRIAGPIHRLRTHLEKILENPSGPRLTFRKNDYFQELAPLINTLAERLKK